MPSEGRDRQEHRLRGEIECPGGQICACRRLLEPPDEERRAHQGVARGPMRNDARLAREALVDFQPEVVTQHLVRVTGRLGPESARETPGADPGSPAAGEGPVEGGPVRGERPAPGELTEAWNEILEARGAGDHVVADVMHRPRGRPDGNSGIHQGVERERLDARAGFERHGDRRDFHDAVLLRIEARRLDVDDVDVLAHARRVRR